MLIRLHSFLGVVLSAYLLVHVYANWPALYDREAWLDRALHGPSRAVALALVALLLLAHAGLGALRFLRGRSSAADASADERGLTTLQALTGALVLAFVVYHVVTLRSVDLGPHADARAIYASLWRNLGRPGVLAVYVVGSGLACFHAAQGLSRIAISSALGRGPRGVLRARLLAGAFGFAVFALFLQLLGHFALGVGTFG